MMITEQQKEILKALSQIDPVSAKGLRSYLLARIRRGLRVVGGLEKSALGKRLRRLEKRGLIYSNYVENPSDYSFPRWSKKLCYIINRMGKKVLRDN